MFWLRHFSVTLNILSKLYLKTIFNSGFIKTFFILGINQKSGYREKPYPYIEQYLWTGLNDQLLIGHEYLLRVIKYRRLKYYGL